MLLFNAQLSEYFSTTFCNILEKEVSNLRARRMNHNLTLKLFLVENEFFKLLCIWYSNEAVGFTVLGSIPERGKRFFPIFKMSRSGLGPILLHILCVSLPFPSGVMLVTHLHPVLQFGMSSTGRLLLWAFVACTRTALSFAASQILFKGGHCTVLSILYWNLGSLFHRPF